jgi:hypothetical protein
MAGWLFRRGHAPVRLAGPAYAVGERWVLTSARAAADRNLSGLPYPFAVAIRSPVGWRETAASVEPLRALIVWMRQEVDPRLVPPLRLADNSVQYDSPDPPAPSFGKDVEKAEEAAAGYDRA